MQAKRYTVIALTIMAVGVAAYLYFARAAAPEVRTRYIAYIGRYTNAKDSIPIERQEKNLFDLFHETALRDYLAALGNAADGIVLKLKTFDNRCDRREATSARARESGCRPRTAGRARRLLRCPRSPAQSRSSPPWTRPSPRARRTAPQSAATG